MTTAVAQNTVTSKDGTVIAFSRVGEGPALILVDGALCYRAFGPSAAVAAALAPHFTVITYDRPSRMFGQWQEPVFQQTGQVLDQKMEILIRRLAA